MVIAGAVGNSETRAAALVMIVLGLIAFPVLKRLADSRRNYQQILYAGLAFKVTMTIVRYYLASGGYYKTSDASDYDTLSRQIASQYLKHGQLPPWKTWTGTPFLRLVTGFVYTIVPASKLTAFFVSAAFSFAGTLLFWKAVQKFAPPPSDRTYLLMLMFIPSFVYWPSALGKEAFIILCLGLTTYGGLHSREQGRSRHCVHRRRDSGDDDGASTHWRGRDDRPPFRRRSPRSSPDGAPVSLRWCSYC